MLQQPVISQTHVAPHLFDGILGNERNHGMWRDTHIECRKTCIEPQWSTFLHNLHGTVDRTLVLELASDGIRFLLLHHRLNKIKGPSMRFLLLFFPVFLFQACNSSVSKDSVKRLLKENPDILAEAIQANPTVILDAFKDAAQKHSSNSVFGHSNHVLIDFAVKNVNHWTSKNLSYIVWHNICCEI